MSLLTSTNEGAPGLKYFIENIGGAGVGAADAPCAKGSSLGALRIGDPADGLILRGDTLATANSIRGGQAAGGSLTIGNSTASFQNIALADGVTTVNGTLNASNDVAVFGTIYAGGNIVLTDGVNDGRSISGYYINTVAVAGSGAVGNPGDLTTGVYSVILVPTNPTDRLANPAGVFYWSGTAWYGNAVSSAFTAGVPNCVISPAAGLATLEVTGTGVPAGNLVFRKLLN